tara:strand:+ start:2331 stop:3170 length:840 start_codon:yes stop_codon:yes gene_type:complete
MAFNKKHILLSFIVILTMNSCKKNDFDVVNLNGNRVSPIGHGGMGADNIYPKNCFESIINSFTIGAEGVELDIQMTKDNVLVIFHDKDLSHSTNISGEIWKMNWAEIDGARYKFPLLTNYKVITLEMLLENSPEFRGKLFFMDYKKNNPNLSAALDSRILQAFIRLVDKYGIAANTRMEFGASQLGLIELFRENRADLPIFIYTKDLDEGIKVGLQYSAIGIVMPSSVVSGASINKAHQNQLMVAVYGIHTKAGNIDMIENNVDFIQSDKLKHLLKVLK